jgi:asparagine synthase (glutamine-hydrolysing)
MSAIFGILRFDGVDVSSRDLERMSNALAHRGPDRRKFVVDGPIALGQCLMRVNREDSFEVQPLYDRTADARLVADLRLDNREELAVALGIGATDLLEMPDSALLMRAYGTWGEACAEHLLGDFAFAIWDVRARKLVLGRDHMGQRYLHFHCCRGFFAFATDLKALWSYPDVPHVLLEAQIGRMLIGARTLREGATLFEGIDGLPGATIMVVEASGEMRRRRYWEPHADPIHQDRDEAYYIEAYRRVLGEAVACRIRRITRPPGLTFSGGYDSAAIAGLVGPVLAKSGRKLVAAASVMPADYQGTIRHARPWVEMCARHMPHLDVRYVTREGKTVLSGLEQAFVALGLPAASYSFVTHELLSALAGAGTRLIMDGHGGDYTLNPRGQAALARFLATWQLSRFFSELRGHLRLSGHSLWATLKADVAALLLPRSVLALWRRFRRGPASRWGEHPINPAFADLLVAQGAIDGAAARVAGRPSIDMRARMASVLGSVTSSSAPGLAALAALHGLELTRPFHDKRVVELALAIPQDIYVKNGRNRHLACAALTDVYPSEFQTRWRKNDDEIPDFQRMAKSIEPRILAECARMEKLEIVTRYVDFTKIRRLLAHRGASDHNSGWEQETQIALRGFLVARYLEWFQPNNR